jgi:hypothetical protein
MLTAQALDAIHRCAALSHQSTASVLSLPLLVPYAATTVTVPPGTNPRRRNGIVRLPNGLRHTTAARTVLDLSRVLDLPAAVAIADAALRRQVIDVATLEGRAAAATGRGCRQARQVAGLVDPRSGSVFESVTRVALELAGLGPVSAQFRLEPDGHPFDLALPWAQLLIECDSWEHHRRPAIFVLDRADANTIAATARWRLLRLVWSDVWPDPARAVRLVQAAVLAGSGRRVRVRRHRAASDNWRAC